jgi:hypothetical protein
MDAVQQQEIVEGAARAYVYGYPLVYSMGEAAAFVAGSPRFPSQAPYNEFGHVRALAGPDFKFVTPNNDTIYSIAVCDVRSEPVVLHLPDSTGRYLGMQFIDAWTNNFAYLGSRVTGSAPGNFLIVGPGDDTAAPAGFEVIQAPSGVIVLIGRVQVFGADDLDVARDVQSALTLTPLSTHLGGASAPPPPGLPVADPSLGTDLGWWEQFRLLINAFPPPPGDADLLEGLAKLGVMAPESPYASMDPALAELLVQGAKAGQAKVDELMQQVHAGPTGWQVTTHLFDFNRDYLGPGTIDSDAWRLADRTTAYATRAVIARAGLWGNHGYEATYALVWVDGDGQPLDGANRYELRLEQAPPVDAFWSLTMYAPPEFYLVENSINRYAIGSATPGLVTDTDGSVTLYIQHESPGPDKESNWLPAPAGRFRPVMRMYQPREPILDGSYQLAAIRRVAP